MIAELREYASAHRYYIEGVKRTGVLMRFGEPEPAYRRLESAYDRAATNQISRWLMGHSMTMRLVLWLL